MKKYLFGALALPLLFACSSEDFDEKVVSNDQFAGIAKVDATFSMDEGAMTRMKSAWAVEYGDKFGFAWLGDGTVIKNTNPNWGQAFQNHPLTVVNETGRGKIFKPQTSIYVGDYYLYYPYDYSTVDIDEIKFNSLVNQPLADGANETWPDVAKNAIIIGDKWTNVTVAGWNDAAGKNWDKAGIDHPFSIYAAFFSNQTALDLTYSKNNPAFAAATAISGATDINFTIAAGETVGAADIYSATVKLDGAANSFTYAPTAEPNGAAHKGYFWEDQKNLNATIAGAGFTFADAVADVITLNAPEGAPVSTGAEGNKGWFWFNSLPATTANAISTSNVKTVFTTSYGTVTVTKTLAQCAWAYEDINPTAANHEIGGSAWNPAWIQLAAADAAPTATTPRKWNPAVAAGHNTFVNQYGNHKGKYAFTVDFSTGVMNNMHIVDDAHLQKALKYYLASGKTENVSLNLDGASASDKTFKLSKISIALLQSIPGNKVKVHACASHNNPVKIIVTQEGQTGDLATATEVPNLANVFDAATDVYLANCDWTWTGGTTGANAYKNPLIVDGNVTSITNEGTLTVNAKNVEIYDIDLAAKAATTLTNAAGATMNITKVTTVQNDLTNNGTINVGAADNTAAELRAYNATVTNNATSLTAYGTINNYGVVGKSAGTTGLVNNYGHINMTDANAITLLNSNEVSSAVLPKGPFSKAFAAGTNMMGTVVLPEGNPYALVSVSNGDETGFIKYNWTASTYSHDAGNVKYNTIVVSNNITFTGGAWNPATEIKFIEFNGTRSQVVNPSAGSYLPNLKGVIVNAGKSIILEKTNVLDCLDGAYLGAGATIYRGGDFLCNGANFAVAQTTNYLGTWSLDQIVEW